MLENQNTTGQKYWAFISYSSKDKKWGKWLHKRLENYPIPPEFHQTCLFDGAVLGKNLRPIFRDRDELSGSSDLGPSILKGLRQSRFLIVLCSPNSARSSWVDKEIQDFISLHPENHRRILALILEGEPNATSNAAIDSALECFPPALRSPVEPLAGDLRKDGDGKERGFLKILSGIAQLDFDTLYRRHERAQKRKRLTLAAAAALLILVLTVLTAFAFQQKNQATIAQRSAQLNAYEAHVAKEKSERSLYFNLIANAHAAAIEDSPLDAMTSLANCPEGMRSWEWSFLSRLVGFAPIVLHPSDIALLDSGPLKGSGLREGIGKLLALDGAEAGFGNTRTENLESITTEAPLPDNTGGDFFITRTDSVVPLAHYRVASFGEIRGSWISHDGSVVAIVGTKLSTPLHRIGATPQKEGEDLWIHIVPVPLDLHFIPDDDGTRDGEDEGEPDGETAAPELHAFPNGMLTASIDGAPLLCAFPSENPTATLVPKRLEIPERIYETTMAHQVLQSLAPGATPFPSDHGGPHILAINWAHPDLHHVTFAPESGFTLHTFGKPAEDLAIGYPEGFGPGDLTDPHNPYPAAAFSTDGSRLALWAGGFTGIPLYTITDSSFGKTIALPPFPDSLIDYPGAAWLRFSENGGSITLTKEHRNTIRLEVADIATSTTVLSHPSSSYRAADWTPDGALFAIWNDQENVIHLMDWPGQTLLKTLSWQTARYGAIDLLRELPGPRRLLAGKTLLDRASLREIIRFPDPWELAPGGDWVAIPGTRSGRTYRNGEFLNYDQASLRIVRNINGQIPDTSLATRIRLFQLQTLGTE